MTISDVLPDQIGRSRLATALCFVAGYFALQAVLVTLVSNGAGIDDAEQLAYIGPLHLGYGGSQLPLYTWIASTVSHVLGISLFTLQIVKFALLASIYVSVYCGARLLGLSRAAAGAGMLAIFLLPPIGWESQRALTHSVAGMAGSSWAFLAFAWHMRRNSLFSAAIFGLAIAAALLGKPNASIFIAGLVLTALTIPTYRRVLVSRSGVLTVLVTIAALAPTAWWMLGHKAAMLARTSKFSLDDAGPVASRLMGLGELVQGAVLFSAPMLVFFAIMLWRQRASRRPSSGEIATPQHLFLTRLVPMALAVVVAGILVSGTSRVEDRWLQPVLFLAPLALVSTFAPRFSDERGFRRLSFWSALVALLMIPVLAYNLHYGRAAKPPIGQLDYAALYRQAHSELDFRTVLSDGPQLPGNMRLFDPTLTPVHYEMPDSRQRIRRPLLVVWFGDKGPPAVVPMMLKAANLDLAEAKISHMRLRYLTRPSVERSVSYALFP
jgi:hypothetical protein